MSSNETDRQRDRDQDATDDGQRQGGANGGGRSGRNGSNADPAKRIGGWFGEVALRGVVAIVGVVLVLLGLGELTNVDLYSMVVNFVTSATGQWIIVAVVGVALIGVASRRWGLAGQLQ